MSLNCSKVQEVLEELGFKQYWNLFLAPPPFSTFDIHSSSGNCEAPSTFFFLHSSTMSFYWNAPSISRWTVWSCRRNRVTACDTSKHSWSCDRCVSMSIHILSRTGTEIEVNVNAGFCLGLASAMGFLEAVFSSFAVGIDSVTYSSTPFTILTQETVLSWKWDLTVFMMTNFYVQDWSDSCVLENPSSCTSFLLVSRHCVFSA